MKSDFKLVGLGRKKSMTCHTNDKKQNIFWPTVQMAQDRFDALSDYFSTMDKMLMVAEIEHEGLYEDGTPIKPIVTGVRDWDLD